MSDYERRLRHLMWEVNDLICRYPNMYCPLRDKLEKLERALSREVVGLAQ